MKIDLQPCPYKNPAPINILLKQATYWELGIGNPYGIWCKLALSSCTYNIQASVSMRGTFYTRYEVVLPTMLKKLLFKRSLKYKKPFN